MTMRHCEGPRGPEEEAWALRFEREQEMENGYRTQQGTRPQTLSYAMMDSPVGVAAWIVEKFHSWSDIEGDDLESAHDRDTLLANIMVYLVTGTFNTASWIYRANFLSGKGVMRACSAAHWEEYFVVCESVWASWGGRRRLGRQPRTDR